MEKRLRAQEVMNEQARAHTLAFVSLPCAWLLAPSLVTISCHTPHLLSHPISPPPPPPIDHRTLLTPLLTPHLVDTF